MARVLGEAICPEMGIRLLLVTAVTWDEWEGIVMVTIVLVGACVCHTDPDVFDEGRVLFAKIGVTVAAATGVPVLKMVF